MSLLEESSSQKKNYHRLVKLAVTFVVIVCYTFIQLRTSLESSSSSIILDDDSVIVVNSQQQQQLTTTTVMWDNNNNNNGHYFLQKNAASVSNESKYNNSNNNNNNNSTIQILSQEDLHPLTVLLLSSSNATTTSNDDNNNNIPNNNNNILLFELGSKSKYHGLGSLTMNILLFDMYFHETQPQRKLVVDQTKLEYYRYNTSLGLYSGWFTTSFPVLDSTHNDLQRVQQELKLYYYYNYHHNRKNQSQSHSHHHSFVWNPIPYYYHTSSTTKNNNNNDTINILKISHKTQREWKLGFMKARSVARKYYGLASKQSDVLNWSFNSSLFYRLTKQYCTSIKFTSNALHQITSSNNQLQLLLFDDKSLSSSFSESVSGGHLLPPMMKKNLPSSSSTTTTMKSSSVAFHIRQGDKISATNHNWKLHNVNEYISKFKSVLFLHNNNNNNNNNINNGPSQQRLLSSLKYCFVATDNPDVVIPALAEALINASIPCQLYTLQLAKNKTVNTTTAYDNDNNDNDDDSNNNNNNVNNNDRKSQLSTLRLMSELRLLVDATYFVGTFASNVGRLVTLWRGCKVYQSIDPQKFTNHHSHSYGIDTEYWTM